MMSYALARELIILFGVSLFALLLLFVGDN